MSAEKPNWHVVAAYLAGEMSADEKMNFEAWIKASKENELLFRESQILWKNSGKRIQLADVDTENEWQRLEQKMVSRSFFHDNLWMKVAAAIALLAVAIYGLIVLNLKDDIIIASGDHVATVYLPDSTRVWLNVNSSLVYADDFDQEHRKVHLKGEGYFDVRHDSLHKFVVTTEDASIEVLGTAFNVQEDSSTLTLSVEKGKVLLLPSGQKKGEEVAAQEIISLVNNVVMPKKKVDGDFSIWRKVRNPHYELEKSQPQKFLNVKFSWRKNAINQSVVEGNILNTASLAEYTNIDLAVTYSNLKGKSKTITIKIDGKIGNGEKLTFSKKLFDIFRDTQHMEVSVRGAEVVQ
ncbi:FecR family protein [Pseudochryseolinea flava]|uniref:FecR protein domain-containing protein n=1 Tax=Pseudochryseolinea flava TaxID=2059302 RepID=A0A364Y2I5_9BACT|nr:FecR family protein [Pseudochryseolinea flava]RAW00892.1 hypothetical protein DQQ10_11660 [Pseudochryseolinea flava]